MVQNKCLWCKHLLLPRIGSTRAMRSDKKYCSDRCRGLIWQTMNPRHRLKTRRGKIARPQR